MNESIDMLASPMKKSGKKGQMKVRSINVKKLDDGTVLIGAEYRDGYGNYESKEYSYTTAEEAGNAVRDFLKEGKGLAERRDKS